VAKCTRCGEDKATLIEWLIRIFLPQEENLKALLCNNCTVIVKALLVGTVEEPRQ